jgi:hypothetical protein
MSKWQGVFTGGGALLLLAGIGIALAAGRPTAGAGEAAIGVNPVSQNVTLGSGAFNIDIRTDDVENLGAFEITLKFDRTVLEYVSASDGGFLASTGRVDTCAGSGIDPNKSNGEDRGVDPVLYDAPNIGAVHFGCTTIGIVENGSGLAGPSGAGILATVTFKPKSLGTSPLSFGGLEANPYIIKPVDGALGAAEGGHTALSPVETCNGPCGDLFMPVHISTGAVAVVAPDEPTPTGVPNTPTPAPRPENTPDIQATVRAVLGTPERRLTDARTPATAASTGSGSGTGGGSSVLGSSAGPGGSESGGSGSIAGSSSRGPGSAPVAGYGPEPSDPNPWPGRASIIMISLGACAVAGGMAARRRGA